MAEELAKAGKESQELNQALKGLRRENDELEVGQGQLRSQIGANELLI